MTKANNMDKRLLIRLSLFISLASVLQIFETFLIPPVIPGLKIGLANIITVILLYKYSWKYAVIVAVMRTIVSSLFLGTFLTPSFILSFSGALISSLIMVLIIFIPYLGKTFSIFGVSVMGSIAHTFTQFIISYYLFIKHSGVFYFLPILLIISVISGIITGYISSRALKYEFIN
jgi:heptaprenyl diphosphate synthase